MQVILNVTYSLPKHPRLICFYIINILFLEDNIVMQFLKQDEKNCWAKKLQMQLLYHRRKPYKNRYT